MQRIRFIHPRALTCTLCALLLGPLAMAAPTEADKETARSLMDQGDAKAEAKDFAAALKLYQAADDLMGVPTTGLEVARMQAALGQLLEARDTALAVARIAVQPKEPRVFAQARGEAGRLADTLAARIPAVQFNVQGVNIDVPLTVEVDGASVPPSAALLPRKVNPGKHHIQVTAPGYQLASGDVEVVEGKVVDVLLLLQQQTPAAAVVTPPVTAQPAPTPALQQRSQQPTPATRRGLPTLSYVGFGVGAAGMIAGSITGLLTFSKKSSIQSTYCQHTNDCNPSAQDSLNNGHTLATISNVAFGVGIVGIGAGVAAWLAAPSESQSPPAALHKVDSTTAQRLTLTPVIGANKVGVYGTF